MELSSFSPSQRRLGAAVLLLVVVVVVGLPRLTSHRPAAAAAPPLRTAIRTRAPGAAELVVDVAGAVRRPGLYHLARGTRIADAVAAAGGATAKADTTAVNLASPLADGEEVLVPGRAGVAGTFGAGAGGAASPAAPVDLNSATPEQLDTLPGIGPSTAQKIVAFRQEHGPFNSLAELDAVPGIGPSRIAELKGLVLP